VYLTLDRPWQAHSKIAGWKQKSLAGRFERNAAVTLVAVPMDVAGPTSVAIAGDDAPRWLFVLSGDLTLSVTTNGASATIHLREGGFLKWSPAATIGFAPGAASAGGATVLCIGQDLAAARAD